jgi:hypothetical protein
MVATWWQYGCLGDAKRGCGTTWRGVSMISAILRGCQEKLWHDVGDVGRWIAQQQPDHQCRIIGTVMGMNWQSLPSATSASGSRAETDSAHDATPDTGGLELSNIAIQSNHWVRPFLVLGWTGVAEVRGCLPPIHARAPPTWCAQQVSTPRIRGLRHRQQSKSTEAAMLGTDRIW